MNQKSGADRHQFPRKTKQGRQAEYDRLTALPLWARTLGEIVRCESDNLSASRRNEARSLSWRCGLILEPPTKRPPECGLFQVSVRCEAVHILKSRVDL